jgi:hypothetical protein
MYYAEGLEFVGPQDISELFDVETGIVKFGTSNYNTAASKKPAVEIAHRKRDAVRDEQQARIREIWCVRGNKFKLNGPLCQLRRDITCLGIDFFGGVSQLRGRHTGTHKRHRLRLFYLAEMLFCRFLVKGFGFPLRNLNRVLRTVPDTSAKAVAIGLTDQFCFAVDYLYCAFRAGFSAKAATIAFFFVYNDYISQGHSASFI